MVNRTTEPQTCSELVQPTTVFPLFSVSDEQHPFRTPFRTETVGLIPP